jgi:hypothetical protein
MSIDFLINHFCKVSYKNASMGQYFTLESFQSLQFVQSYVNLKYIGAVTVTAIFFIEEVKRRLKEKKELKEYLVDGFEEGTIGPDGQLVSSWGQWVPLDEDE